MAVYYLQQILGLEGITLNHVYTCYREVGFKAPDAFGQSLRDTASRTGNLDTSNTNSIKITHRGVMFVEHDLPVPPKKKP